MSEAQPQPWHREPDSTNLPPDSFTAQKLVCDTHTVLCGHWRALLMGAATCDA